MHRRSVSSSATSSSYGATRRPSRFRAEADASLKQAAVAAAGRRRRAAGKRPVFDIDQVVCQSKLYDAFELQELQKQLDRTLATSQCATADHDQHVLQGRPCWVSPNQEISDKKSPIVRKPLTGSVPDFNDDCGIKANAGMLLEDQLHGNCVIQAKSRGQVAEDLHDNCMIAARSGMRLDPRDRHQELVAPAGDEAADCRRTATEFLARSPTSELNGAGIQGAKGPPCKQEADPSTTHVHHHHHFHHHRHHHHHHIVHTEEIDWPFSPVRPVVQFEDQEEILWPFSPVHPAVHFEDQEEILWPFSPVHPAVHFEESNVQIRWPLSPVHPSIHFKEVEWPLSPAHQWKLLENPKGKGLHP